MTDHEKEMFTEMSKSGNIILKIHVSQSYGFFAANTREMEARHSFVVQKARIVDP